MRSVVLGLASVFLFAGLAEAQVVKEFQFVGTTMATFNGSAGIIDLNQGCLVDFPASRMCTTLEVVGTIAPPTVVTEAWVRPVFKPTGLEVVLDATGISGDPNATPAPTDIGQLSCDAWTTAFSSAFTGSIIRTDGRLGLGGCSSSRAVACCQLLAVPEPPMALLGPTGLASMTTLALLRYCVAPTG
jgi:hypothetical protein